MNEISLNPIANEIVVDEVFPHTPETIWKALTSGDLMARWLMPPTGFAAVTGTHFTFQTTASGAWDGTIHCEVLQVVPNERLAYSWKGGHEANTGYGSLLDTVVTFTLTKAASGTRVRCVQSGFVSPKNDTAFKNLSEGWKNVMNRLSAAAGEHGRGRS